MSLESAGISKQTITSVMPTLGPSLLHRFSTKEAYLLAEGVPKVFESLRKLIEEKQEGESQSNNKQQQQQHILRWNLATNSDSRILTVCQSLGLSDYLNIQLDNQHHGRQDFRRPQSSDKQGSEPSLSYFLGYEKPHISFFHKAVSRAFSQSSDTRNIPLSQLCAQTVYVGDHYEEDYIAARRAGLQAIWLKRAQPWPSSLSEADRKEVMAVQSMNDVVNLVRQSWSYQS